MDGRQPEYTQSGLNSPYAPYNGNQSEQSPADQASAVQYQPGPDYKSSNFSSSATPNSEYGLPPQSARSGSFPEYIQRSYAEGQQQQRYPVSQGAHAGMAQTSIKPYLSSPWYSPYPPQQEMQQYPAQPMYPARPEWAGQYQQPMAYGHSPATTAGAVQGSVAHIPRPPAVGSAPHAVYPQASNWAQGGHPLSTVYSFVPIPGAQQHKRPRRRYEEIERMYKCGWNGCEKAYGTLNHLNAHVTMQGHGTKRTPEEFKEIRKDWKAKKKEEDNQRKQEDERQRQEAARNGQDTSQPQPQPPQYQQHMMPPQMGAGPQLPPIGYQHPSQPQQVEGAPQYGYGAQGYPQSPYAQGGLQYQQRA
ncbi:hypothetical protein LTS01_004297 [Friedmanniomyces endolithicus]|nr:hypothetical protein LTS01_004297 [Friedmanniomyces endolithicus]